MVCSSRASLKAHVRGFKSEVRTAHTVTSWRSRGLSLCTLPPSQVVAQPVGGRPRIARGRFTGAAITDRVDLAARPCENERASPNWGSLIDRAITASGNADTHTSPDSSGVSVYWRL